MKLLKIKRGFISAAFLLLHLLLQAIEPPVEELFNLQKRYPEHPVISTAKNLDVIIEVDKDGLKINQKYYREVVVLTDNASFFADSKEYFNSHYYLNKFEAYTLVPEGKQYKKVPVPKYTKTVEIDDIIFYDDQQVYNYTFPAVGKGSKLVTLTDATTRYPYVPVLFDFGSSIPGENMSVTITCPRDVKIQYHLFGKDTGIIQMNRQTKGDKIIYSWQANNPNVYDLDDLSPDSRYVIPHLIVQIASYSLNREQKPVIGTIKDLYDYNYSHISNLSKDPSATVKSLADSVVGGIIDPREKVRIIYKWVQQHIKYIAIEDGENGLVPSEAALVLKRRYGDCKGKTSLLVAMMRSQGLDASFAWVGSRERPYKYSVFPSVAIDDHMIAVWWDKQNPVILDGTTYSHRMEDVPSFIQGKECLIEKGKDDFMLYVIPVAPPANNAICDSIFMEVMGDSIIGNGVVTFYGENKAIALHVFDGGDTAQYRGLFQDLLPKASNKHIIKSVSIDIPEKCEEPFRVRYSFVLPDFIICSNGNKYVSMNQNRYLNKISLKEDRKIPVESEMCLDYKVICTLQVPENYKVSRVPDEVSFNHSLFGFNEQYSLIDKTVTLSSTVSLNFLTIDGPELQQFRSMLIQLNKNYLKSLTLERIKT